MKRFALFVGINAYPGNRLHCARADAEVLYKEFSRHYDVARLLVDKKATPNAIVRELDSLQKQANAGDMLLFYFSGHGSDYGGERLWAIPDYDKHGKHTGLVGLSTATVREETDVLGLHRLFVLDCCRTQYDGETDILDEAKAAGKATGFVRRHGRRSIVRPTLLSSSSPGQTSYENQEAGHGFFTEALIATLHDDSVCDFNHFRDHLDYVMSRQRKPGDQDPYFEGPIGSDLPFWPAWDGDNGNGDVTSEPVEQPQRTRRHPRRKRNEPEEPNLRKPQVTNSLVSKAFKEAESLSRCFFLKSEFIPADKLANACESMGVRCAPSRVLALYDDTVFGGSREGFVIAPEGIYAKNYGGSPMFFKWGSIDHLGYRSGIITINDSELCAADCYLSMEAKEAVYNGIIKVEEQISGEKFGNSDDDDYSDDDDGNDDYESDGEDEEEDEEEEDSDGDEAEDDEDEDDAEEDGEDGDSDDGDAWTPDPELLRQVNAALRKR